ncbi:MAG TPA: hypothetical protein P5243_01635 [Bacteroidales bacterium]|mgnify:FL=1|jgi:cell division protein FtsQ|nr:hypothetical protein [Bacteroidales bacterium]HRS18177.1 hypothetical protein [Bacteroidales bacterium]
MKKILPYIPLIVLLIIASVSVGFSESYRNELVCKDVLFAIDEKTDKPKLLTESDILGGIKKTKKDFIGKKINSIPLHDIEDAISNNPSVLACECFVTIDGILHIKIQQRIPVVRIVGLHDNYYIDEHGRLMPLSQNYTARTLVASGNIPEGFRKSNNVLLQTQKDSSSLKDIFLITMAIRKNQFLNSLIEQIYVHNKSQYILISKIGPAIIEFGAIDEYEKKLQNLQAFYMSQKVRENWHLYEKISVKYSNQIVCTKY